MHFSLFSFWSVCHVACAVAMTGSCCYWLSLIEFDLRNIFYPVMSLLSVTHTHTHKSMHSEKKICLFWSLNAPMVPESGSPRLLRHVHRSANHSSRAPLDYWRPACSQLLWWMGAVVICGIHRVCPIWPLRARPVCARVRPEFQEGHCLGEPGITRTGERERSIVTLILLLLTFQTGLCNSRKIWHSSQLVLCNSPSICPRAPTLPIGEPKPKYSSTEGSLQPLITR